jgi:hypothetical protein
MSAELDFSVELHSRRLAAGLSLTGLADKLHYSKSHLSKIESGAKRASLAFARRCDQVLGTGGVLAQLLSQPTEGSTRRSPDEAVTDASATGMWVVRMAPGGPSDFHAFEPHALTGAPVGSVLSHVLSAPRRRTGNADAALPAYRGLLDHLRALGQTIDPALVSQMLITGTHTLHSLARTCPPDEREPAYRLAARFAEFAGWMAQENGDDEAGQWWTDYAVELAGCGGDVDLATYALVRRAEFALYRDDWATVVELAQHAQRRPGSARVHSLAAQREAQGHAFAGDEAACLRALDRAAELMRLAEGEPTAEPTLGSALTDPVAFATAWCRQDLGQFELAIAILTAELQRLPEQATRARARYGARLALAYADLGDIASACAAAEPVLAAAADINSATIRHDLRRMARILNRRGPTDPHVRRISVALAGALQGNPGRPLRYEL